MMEIVTNKIEASSPLVLGAAAFGISVLGFAAASYFSGPPKGLEYPPGPPRDPIIGNLRNFPKGDFYKPFCEWQKRYGDIVYVQLPGMAMVVVNSYELAHELLSKRASNTSGRKMQYIVTNLLGWGWALPFRQADSAHRQMRKVLRNGIGPLRVSSHDAIVESCSSQLVGRLGDFHGDPHHTIFKSVARVVTEVAYGERIEHELGHQFVGLNKQAHNILDSSMNKFWFVDVFLILRFIPSWMPGAEFRRRGIKSTKLSHQIQEWPFQRCLELYTANELGHCLAADALNEFVGNDTATGTIHHCLHCLFLFPDIASRMQQELQEVLGPSRLPRATDRARLPYTEAVWKEALRWNAAIAIAPAHMNTKAEVINGYYIPAGTLVNPNIGFMLNDPKIWGDPEAFRPERHLQKDSGIPNPNQMAFGFGTRICPGMYLADRVGFHFVATIMSMYDILPLEGKSVPDASTVQYLEGPIRTPLDFQCRFVPRNKEASDLLSALALSDTP